MTQKFDGLVFRRLLNRKVDIEWERYKDSIVEDNGILRGIYKNSIMLVHGNEEIYLLKNRILLIKASRRYDYVRGKKVNNKNKPKDKRHYERNR